MTDPNSTRPTKVRRKRVRARFVNGREAMKDWGYAYSRQFWVIDALGVAKQDDWSCQWFAVKPEALALSDGEFAVAIANDSAGATELGYHLYDRYIVDFCDEAGNIIETVR